MDPFRLLADAAPDGVLVVEGGRVTYSNAAAASLLGAAGAGRQAEIVEAWAGEQPSFRDAWSSWLAGLPAAAVDVTLATGTGGDRTLSVAGARVGDAAPPAVQLMLRDVTAARVAARRLRDSEERLTLAVAGARIGVWDWDLRTDAILYSDLWKEMLGYAGDEIEPHVSAWERLVHPDDRVRADRAHESVARGDRAYYEAEFRLRHKDGHYVHILSRGYPIFSHAGGPVVRIVGTHFDLSERKLAEAALRESEERLKLAFEGAQEGVWDWNLETGGVVYSPRWVGMLGYEPGEIEPHVSAWERLLHPDDVARAQRASDQVAGGAATYEGEFRLRHKDGHYITVLSRGYPVRRQPDGRAVRIVGTHFDLTERRRAEAERTRTELLSRLVFAQEDERRRIAREMHDQFGEHLTALAARVRALGEAAAGDATLRPHVEMLEGLAQRLDRDVDQLVWELRPTALDDLGLRAALENYVHDWSRRVGVEATLHTAGLLDDRLPPDVETALYRIAQEALTNVARHARAGHVEIILERRGGQVLLVVEDDGVGFEVAGAGDGGQSFGLIGMRERAALVGATLEIESAPAAGTTVFVRMPADTPAAVGGHG